MFPARIEEGNVVRPVGDEMIIQDRTGTRTRQLNTTATLIWRLCDGSHSVSDIVDILAQRFDAPRDRVAEDVAKTVASFAVEGLVSNVDSMPKAIGASPA